MFGRIVISRGNIILGDAEPEDWWIHFQEGPSGLCIVLAWCKFSLAWEELDMD